MPNPADYDTEDAWMSACVSTMMDEGKEQDQAVAACINMWEHRHDKAAVSGMTTSNTGGLVQTPPPEVINKAKETVNRAYSLISVKAMNAERRELEGIATTPEVDRIGDIVDPMGGVFKLPLPLLWQHKHDQPVGHVVAAKATKDGITIKAKIERIDEEGELKKLLDLAWQSVKLGLVRGLSIGFSPVWEKVEMLKDGGLRYPAWGWHELSLVTIPANASASISLVKSLDLSTQAASGNKRAPVKLIKPLNPAWSSKTKAAKVEVAYPTEITLRETEQAETQMLVQMRGRYALKSKQLAVPVIYKDGSPVYVYRFERV